ncbi:MAG: TIM barrel protein [Nitrospinae bacterium]|nr:TIM barrel protein [Nitrospinota bacterium]
MKKKQIRVGNQTAFSAMEPALPFQYAIENHFGAFEWFPDKKESGAGWEAGDIGQDFRRYIKETAEAHDVTLSVHAPLLANPLKSGTRELIFVGLELAKDIGARLLNIHLYAEEGIPAFADAIGPVLRRAVKEGILLTIENTPLTSPEDFNALFTLLQKQGGPSLSHVGMCLDLGHANLHASTQNDYLGFMDRLERMVPVIHLHLHENHGDYDAHLPAFTGPAGRDDAGMRGAVSRLKKRGFSGCVIMEQWPQPPSLLNQARDRFSGLWDGL